MTIAATAHSDGLNEFSSALLSRRGIDPNTKFMTEPSHFVTLKDLRLGESGWVRPTDVYWIVYQNKQAPFIYRKTKIFLDQRPGYDVEIRREYDELHPWVMFSNSENFLNRMNEQGAQQVYEQLAGRGGIESFLWVLFRDQ